MSASQAPVKAPFQTANMACYLMMMGMACFALIFLILSIAYEPASSLFFFVFIVEGVGALALYAYLAGKMKGHYTGYIFDHKTIAKEWEVRNRKVATATEE